MVSNGLKTNRKILSALKKPVKYSSNPCAMKIGIESAKIIFRRFEIICLRQDLNLQGFPHTVLSRARIPVPPRRRLACFMILNFFK